MNDKYDLMENSDTKQLGIVTAKRKIILWEWLICFLLFLSVLCILLFGNVK